nr:glycoside hydrolase family 27 protein [Arthrobacter sp.]
MRKLLRLTLPLVIAAAAVPIALFMAQSPAQALENGLNRTPQMGWNDWNSFGCNVSDSLIRQTADTMVSSGMAAAGYKYVNIDDCWSEHSRDSSGNLVPDHTKFPNGIKAVADYVHGKGLKLGIYSSAGLTTCTGYPASLGNEQRDANTWASWGVDYLKYDNCGDTQGRSGPDRYAAMRDALSRSGRAIVFAICNWGNDNVIQWGPATGNSWRTTGDIQGNWNSVMSILDAQPGYAGIAKPGAWNDPDMLEVGNGLSDTEARAHFSLWALLNAPLLAGNDLRTMSATTRSILTNTDVIAVDQDWGGRQGGPHHQHHERHHQRVGARPWRGDVRRHRRRGRHQPEHVRAAGPGLGPLPGHHQRVPGQRRAGRDLGLQRRHQPAMDPQRRRDGHRPRVRNGPGRNRRRHRQRHCSGDLAVHRRQ